VFLSHRLQSPILDGSASIVIGLILAVVAVLLIAESRGLLIGESADSEEVRDICSIVMADPAVRAVPALLTMQIGAGTVLLNMSVRFREDISADALTAAIARIDAAVRAQHSDVKQIFIEASSLQAGGDHDGSESEQQRRLSDDAPIPTN
jgi:divalent metal cation (Fe/Co/Zn/Cd) transporter